MFLVWYLWRTYPPYEYTPKPSWIHHLHVMVVGGSMMTVFCCRHYSQQSYNNAQLNCWICRHSGNDLSMNCHRLSCHDDAIVDTVTI